MQLKNFLAVLALAAAADAAVAHRRSPFSRALQKRQNRNGGFNGGNNGGFNGGNNDGNNNNDGGNNGGNNGGNDNNNNNGGGGAITLNAANVQTGSQQDGQNPGADGQAASATDDSNFINFCEGSQLTNGEQVRGGSCNGIPMGKIPSTNNMPSTVFVSPQNGENIAANQDFDIQVQMINFAPGSFTNATSTYYSAPQDLDGGGNIIGHTHITVQDTGDSLNPTQPMDPTVFAFFKGVNDAGNGQGLLSAAVEGGLPEGNYRVCTMAAAANHQPVLMPVAQRGAQDDCVRFTVGGNGGNNGGDNNGGNNGNQDNGAGQNQDGQNGGQNGDQNAGGQNDGQNGGQNGDQNADGQNDGQNGGQNGDQNAGGQNDGQNGGQNGDQNAGGQNDGQNGGQNGDQNADGQNDGQNGGQNGDQNAGGQNDGQNAGQNGGQNGGGESDGAQDGAGADNNNQAGDGSGDDSGAAEGADNNGGGGGSGGASAASAVGGIAAPEVVDTGDSNRPFGVNGNSFVNKAAAVQRACDIQNNQCSDAVNSGSLAGVTLDACNSQTAQCVAELS